MYLTIVPEDLCVDRHLLCVYKATFKAQIFHSDIHLITFILVQAYPLEDSIAQSSVILLAK